MQAWVCRSKRFIVLDTIFVLALSFTQFDLGLGGQGAVLQAIGLVARFDDVAVVCQPIQQRVPILASPNLLDHSEKLRLDVMTYLSLGAGIRTGAPV